MSQQRAVRDLRNRLQLLSEATVGLCNALSIASEVSGSPSVVAHISLTGNMANLFPPDSSRDSRSETRTAGVSTPVPQRTPPVDTSDNVDARRTSGGSSETSQGTAAVSNTNTPNVSADPTYARQDSTPSTSSVPGGPPNASCGFVFTSFGQPAPIPAPSGQAAQAASARPPFPPFPIPGLPIPGLPVPGLPTPGLPIPIPMPPQTALDPSSANNFMQLFLGQFNGGSGGGSGSGGIAVNAGAGGRASAPSSTTEVTSAAQDVNVTSSAINLNRIGEENSGGAEHTSASPPTSQQRDPH